MATSTYAPTTYASAPTRPTPARPTRLLAEPLFRSLFAGRVLAALASAVAPVLLAFAVLDRHASAAALGTVLAARSVPQLLLLLLGGVVADRLPRHRVAVAALSVAAASQATVAMLVLAGGARLWQLAALEAVNGAASAFLGPATEALTAGAVGSDRVRQGVTLLRVGVTTASTLGAALGGLLLVTAGTGWGFALDAMSFALAALLMRRVKAGAPAARTAPRRTRSELVEGWQVFRRTPWLLAVVLQCCVLNATLAGGWSTLGPVIARDTFGRAGWGVVSTALAVGMVLGGLLLLRLPRSSRMLRTGVAASTLAAPALVVLGLAPSVPALVACVVVGGAAVEVFEVGWQVSIQENVPTSALSRVYSLEQLGTFAAVPLGQLAAGPVAGLIGARHTAVAAGLLTLTATLVTLGRRTVRGLASPAS
jgi:MFS family permease